MAERGVDTDVDARLAADAMAGDAVGLERLQQRLLEPEHVILDVQAEPAQVDQRVGDDLAALKDAYGRGASDQAAAMSARLQALRAVAITAERKDAYDNAVRECR